MNAGDAQLQLARMVDQAHLVLHQLQVIERQIRQAGLGHVVETVPHPRRFTSTQPSHSGWRTLDTLELERITPVIEAARAPEIDALQRRLNRQRAAIEALIARHRLNADPAELLRHDR